MYFLRSGIPFVRFLILLMIGILIGFFCKIVLPIGLIGVVISSYTLFYFIEKKYKRSFYFKSLSGYLLLLILGCILVEKRIDTNRSCHYLHSINKIGYYKAKVISSPEFTSKTLKVVVDVREIKTIQSNWIYSKGKLILYILKDSMVNIQKGDVLFVKGMPSLPPKQANPEQFNYTKYLALQNIYAIHFVSKRDFVKNGNEPCFWLVDLADKFRGFCDLKIKEGIRGENEYRICSALLLGFRAGLDEKIAEAYSDTGTVHALAVSGLHVSLLYFIVIFLFGFIKKIPHGKYIFTLLSLSIFWFYALVTGFSPSVVRAVTMFTVFLIASSLKRNAGIFNTLAFSAFVILCIEPFWLLDIGFQFSFLAVVGIAYIYPILYGWWEPKNKLLDKLWSLICVSMAAQIAVSPLSIYYFHSFPLLFLPFNMLIVPLSSIALYTGLAGLMLCKIKFLSSFAFLITEYLLQFMNYIVQLPAGFDLLKIDFLYIDLVDLTFAYLCITFLFFSLKNKRYTIFVYAVGWFCLFTFFYWFSWDGKCNKKIITLYSIKGKTVLSLIDNGKAIVLSDSLMTKQDKNFRYALYNHFAKEKVSVVSFCTFSNSTAVVMKHYPFGQLIVWNGLKIARIQKLIGEEQLIKSLTSVDFLIVSDNEVARLTTKMNITLKGKVILDTSLKSNTPIDNNGFYDVRKSGAFVYEK